MGVSEALIGVWATVWVQANAPQESKAQWLGFAGMSAGAGNGAGSAVAGFCSKRFGYAFAFVLQSAVLFLLWVIMLFTPPRFFEFAEAAAKAPATPKTEIFDASISNTWQEDSRNEPDARQHRAFHRTTSTDSKLMLQQEIARSMSVEMRLRGNSAGASWTEVGDLVTEDDMVDNEDVSLLDSLRVVLSSRLWLWTAMAISLSNFITSAVAYMWQNTTESVWHFDDKEATWSFLITTGVGGLVGVTCGPKLFDDYLQGFADRKGRITCLRWGTNLMLVAVVLGSGVALLCLDTAWHIVHYEVARQARGCVLAFVLIGVFLVFALVNSMQGTLYGINTDSVTPETKTTAAGLTVSMQNIIGFALGPLLPGIVAEMTGHLIRDAWEEDPDVVHGAQFSTGMAVSLLALWPLLLSLRLAAVEAGDGQQAKDCAAASQLGHSMGQVVVKREESVPFIRAEAPPLVLDPL